MIDVVIIGKGPAGISAALYTKRAGLDTLVIGKDAGVLAKADKIENYYGFPEPISGLQLMQNGIAQARRLGIAVNDEEVLGIEYDGNFTVKTDREAYPAMAVILATGTARKLPPVKGIADYEGRGVSFCAVCDAFFHRGKHVAVIGSGAYALSEAEELSAVVGSVTILTNGEAPSAPFPPQFRVDTRKIAKLSGDPFVSRVHFEDGDELPVSGVFIAVGVAGSTDFARRLGAEIDGNRIITDTEQSTNVPGLFAAGDCTGVMLQINTAVCQGARAGTAVIKYVRKRKSAEK